MISKILEALPELEGQRCESERFCGGRVSQWKVMDIEGNAALLSYEAYSGNPQTNESSGIAVVSGCLTGEYELLFSEVYAEQIKLALLYSATHTVAAVRFEEYDDRADTRYGWDDVFLINYRNGLKESVERFRFEGGAYSAGNIKLDISCASNRLAIVRNEMEGWDNGRIVAAIYDLAVKKIISKAELLNLRSLNSVEFSEDGGFLIITDNDLARYSYKVTGGTLVEVLN